MLTVSVVCMDQGTLLSLGFTMKSSANESHDSAQLSPLKEHHSTWQRLSRPNRPSPMWLYNISEVQSNFYISGHRGETRGALCYRNAASPSPSITISGEVPSDCFALAAVRLLFLSFNVGTRPDTNEDRLLSFFCRCGVPPLPPIIKWRPVNGDDMSPQNVNEKKNCEGTYGQQFGERRR